MFQIHFVFVLWGIVFYESVFGASSTVNKEIIEQQYSRLSEKLKKNGEVLKDVFTQFRRESRNVSTPVAFFAVLTNNYTPMSPYQTISFDRELTNVGHGYDHYFGLFQAPVSGYYQFVLTSLAYTSSSYMVNLEMVKNGNMICRAHAATYGQEGFCVAMVHLNKDDEVWVRHYNGQGTYLYAGNSVSSFSGYLIKAT